ncbi:Protein Smg homolog [Burkholderiales bacterium 8X]|nr:Protein Smg homolog [Burkholderiales bacterium 8X]
MFEVLVFVYENYWRGDACPEPEQLGRKLSAHGFDGEEIRDALRWLDGLSLATQGVRFTRKADGSAVVGTRSAGEIPIPSSPDAMRVYSSAEQEHLGAACLGFISFLEASAVLPADMREIVVDRAMATSGEPVSLDELKIIVMMVYWSTGIEPDTLVLDELCADPSTRTAH